MPKIKHITCHKVVDSRAKWTIETHVVLDDTSVGIQTVPEGASKGHDEALNIPVDKAIDVVTSVFNEALQGKSPFDQEEIDSVMNQIYGTHNKAHLGANSILSVSLAVCKAAAISKKLDLYVYLQKLYAHKCNLKSKNIKPLKFPTPIFNILNGGMHAKNNLSFQEFMIIPAKRFDFAKAYTIGVDIYGKLEKYLEKHRFSTGVGDEGGFAPTGLNPTKALEILKTVCSQNYKIGDEIFFGCDVAADSFRKTFNYRIQEEGLSLSSDELLNYYIKLLNKFELLYLEDPFFEGDKEGWEIIMKKFSNSLLIVGDDLVVTNAKLLKKALDKKLINSVIVKPNQIGTLSETFDFIKLAKENDLSIVVSHRSGDNAQDTFIADLALAVEADFIKSGAPARGERVAKYNRLLEIFYQNQTIE